MIPRSLQGFRPRKSETLAVETLEDRRLLASMGPLTNLGLSLPPPPLTALTALVRPQSLNLGQRAAGITNLVTSDSIGIGIAARGDLSPLGAPLFATGVSAQLNPGSESGFSLAVAGRLAIGSGKEATPLDVGLHLDDTMLLALGAGVAQGMEAAVGTLGVAVVLGPSAGSSTILTPPGTGDSSGGMIPPDLLAGVQLGTGTPTDSQPPLREEIPPLHLLLPPENLPAGAKLVEPISSPSAFGMLFRTAEAADVSHPSEEGLLQQALPLLPAAFWEEGESADPFSLTASLHEAVRLVDLAGLEGHDISLPPVPVQAGTAESGATGDEGAVLIEEAAPAPQDAGLLEGCLPLEMPSLEQLLAQLRDELGSLGGELAGVLARLGLHPSIFLILAAACAAAELARRNLRQSKSLAVDMVFGLWPREAV